MKFDVDIKDYSKPDSCTTSYSNVRVRMSDGTLYVSISDSKQIRLCLSKPFSITNDKIEFTCMIPHDDIFMYSNGYVTLSSPQEE